jgi:RNA polymerase sigma-70 factor (ECF subfamily)
VLRSRGETELLRPRGDDARPLRLHLIQRQVPRVDHGPPDQAPEPAGTPAGGSERLWHEVHDRLTAFVAQRVDDPADVADLVQTVFLRAHQHMASIADEQRLLPWLFQITRNAIADYYRAPVRRREIGGVASDGALDLPDGDRAVSAVAPSEGSSAIRPAGPLSVSDDESAMRELAGCVRPLVELLPATYREALTLVEFDGVPQVEVASRLGISVSGMKSRVQRGRVMLRDNLLACCDVSRSATGGVIDFAPRSDAACGADGSGVSAIAPCAGLAPLRRAPSPRQTPGRAPTE